jgi:transposase-like protein
MTQKAIENVREDKGWRTLVQRVALDCPRCKQTWLILGVGQSHPYTCKACGHSFRVEEKHRTMQKKAGR